MLLVWIGSVRYDEPVVCRNEVSKDLWTKEAFLKTYPVFTSLVLFLCTCCWEQHVERKNTIVASCDSRAGERKMYMEVLTYGNESNAHYCYHYYCYCCSKCNITNELIKYDVYAHNINQSSLTDPFDTYQELMPLPVRYRPGTTTITPGTSGSNGIHGYRRHRRYPCMYVFCLLALLRGDEHVCPGPVPPAWLSCPDRRSGTLVVCRESWHRVSWPVTTCLGFPGSSMCQAVAALWPGAERPCSSTATAPTAVPRPRLKWDAGILAGALVPSPPSANAHGDDANLELAPRLHTSKNEPGQARFWKAHAMKRGLPV